MGKEGEDLLGLLFVAGLGYLAGGAKMKQWEGFVNEFNRRVATIQSAKIIIPWGYLRTGNSIYIIYREAVLSHLFGLPNASIPTVVRVLELALKTKYKEVESAPTNKLRLNDLIDWAGKYLSNKVELAHGFRILRNAIHEEANLSEQDSLETIRHISNLINTLYPWDNHPMPVICNGCRKQLTAYLRPEQYFIGNSITMICKYCGNRNNQFIIP